MEYQPKTEMYDHQRQALTKWGDRPNFALFMEQRTGKTKVVIDRAAALYDKRELSALIVVAAPGRVHRNWVKNEIPDHLPDRIPRLCVVWEAGKIRYDIAKKEWKGPLVQELKDLLKFEGLSVLAINEGAMLSDALLRYLLKFLKARSRVMVAIDEFTLSMASAGAKTTKKLWTLGRQAQTKYRVIMDGTPMESGPLDLYAPFAFLDHNILGQPNSAAFKAHYAKWETKIFHDHKKGTERAYPAIMRDEAGLPQYQNLDEFQRRIAPYVYRVLRKDCWDVPDKVYQNYSFALSLEQRRIYDELATTYSTELDGMRTVTAAHVLTRYMRLQQVTSGFWPSEKVATIHEPCEGNGCPSCEDLGVIITKTALRPIDPKSNPRLKAAEEVLRLNPGSRFIIWARFHEDIDNLMALARSMGYSPVQYDGRCSAKLKDAASDAFQAGSAHPLIGNPKSGGRGLKLSRADAILNCSHDYSLLTRLQSEDRAEEKGKLVGTGIIDLVAEDTIDDTSIVPALRAKKSIVDYVLNERGGKWI